MAMPRKIPVEFGVAFPNGAYAVGEVQPVRDYDKSTRERLVQAVDPDTGLLLWSVEVVDGDPDAKKSNRTLSVKITAKVQPVLPEALTGLPFTPVEFDKLTATAYIEENGDPAGLLTPGVHQGTLASVFCIPATGNFLIDGAANLPGPGATSLPGSLSLF